MVYNYFEKFPMNLENRRNKIFQMVSSRSKVHRQQILSSPPLSEDKRERSKAGKHTNPPPPRNIFEELKLAIMQGIYKPREHFTERGLAIQFGVSRMNRVE